MMAAKTVKKELLNDDIKEFGEDAATAINELLGLYGYVGGGSDDVKRNERASKFHRDRESCKKIANISQKLLAESQRQQNTTTSMILSSESESKINDYSSMSSDKDSTSRENSKSPPQTLRHNHDENNCSWCHHEIDTQSSEIIGSAGTIFCSENCFSFWRRASFKRAKTCDYCKNVRNAVSYVDFNDGTTQLQFCSDKCLNQYKMQIFCRETQAHLELNPHLREKLQIVGNPENLITPEMWLKNCRSRSPTPAAANASEVSGVAVSASVMSRTPTPTTAEISRIIVNTQSQPSSSTVTSANSSNLSSCENSSKKPLINVLPSSKLLSRNLLHQKSLRKRARISGRLNCGSNSTAKQQSITTQNPVNFLPSSSSSSTATDARAQQIHSPKHQNSPVGNFNRPPPLNFLPRPPINLFKFRPPFHNFVPQGMRMPPPPHDNQNHPMNSFLPPPVVLVPHPVVLPIIVPIPMPLSAFWNAYQVGKNPSSSKITSTTPPSSSSSSEIDRDNLNMARMEKSGEEPLDYTTAKSPESNKSPMRDDNADENDDGMMENVRIESTTSCDDRMMETSSNGNNLEKIAEFKITRQTLLKRSHDNEPTTTSSSSFLRDYVNESSRPLRKRRIIAEVDNLSESP